MSGEWPRQKRELDSYNTFFAAIKGEIAGHGLRDLGYRVVGRFLTIPDRRNGIEASPDFVLFNGATLLLVEVKSGENISRRHVEQMKACSELSLEATREYLRETEIRSKGYEPAGLKTVQPCIVYYEDFIERCKSNPGCKEALLELKEYTAILTQDKGSTLQLESGMVNDRELKGALSDGIALPQLPDKNVYLTEGIEKECLAFSISFDYVLNNLGKGRLVVSLADIAEAYANREIPLQRIREVLRFLEELGACRETETGDYEFTTAHSRNIMKVEAELMKQLVDEALDEDPDAQASLADF